MTEAFMLFRSVVLAAFLGASLPTLATPQPIDATGLWIKPDESGWGISVYHQGDTLFASLFTYGPDGQPKWYTASAMTGGPSIYSGALAEATGPYLGASSFDPGAVTRTTVGAITLTLRDSDAILDYTVNGTRVTKQVTRFTMRPLPIIGTYYGVELQPASVNATEKANYDQHINVAENGLSVGMSTDSNRSANCQFDGTRSQNGETLSVAGNYKCANGAAGSGPWSMTIDPTPHGFVGSFNGFNISQGRIAAAGRNSPNLQGTGYINDLWFPPNEGGWGLNLIEQRDTAFATLFVYDGLNRPRWYSASQLEITTPQSGRATWTGSLEESNGPYFGAPFTPSAVVRQVVGTMTFILDYNGDGLLSYTVHGVSVSKRVKRFSFRKNDLTGSYQGQLVMRGDDPRGLSYDDAAFTIDDQGDRVTISMDVSTGPKCTFPGQSIQYGAQRSVYGTYTCQDGATGRFEMNDLLVTADGFTGTYQGPAGHVGGLIERGHISGARR
jgi:hypothetical protein